MATSGIILRFIQCLERSVMQTATRLSQRLASYAEILRLIDARRVLTGSPDLGSAIERFILEAQFVELGIGS
jgi:hypothetical protein